MFRVMAYNFNGAGTSSNEFRFLSCTQPGQAPAPERTATTVDSITIAWRTPDDGGCPVTGFSVHMDDGAGGSFVEVNEDNDTLVRNNPGLHALTIESGFDSGSVGAHFNIKVKTYTEEGTTDSDIATITLGDVPTAPQSAVRKV